MVRAVTALVGYRIHSLLPGCGMIRGHAAPSRSTLLQRFHTLRLNLRF